MHDGGDGDLGGFACGDELLVFAFEVGIEAASDRSRHVERLADVCPAASDEAFALPLARVAGDGDKAGQRGGLLVVERSEFGHGDALAQLADHIENAAARSSPHEAVAARDTANEAYAYLVRVEGAAKNAPAGDFSSDQLEVAVRQGGCRVRGRDISAGQAVSQDYAKAARKVLPSKTGSSGTAERKNTLNPIAWDAGAALAPENFVAQKVAAPLLTRSASPSAQALADLIRAGQPYAAHIAASLLARSTQ